MSTFKTTAEIRQILKAAGINSKRASVAARHSLTYVTITVRDHTALAATKAAVKGLNTWSMDNTDYVEGQSVTVTLSDEAREAISAPFVATVEAAAIPEMNSGNEILPGVILWNTQQGVYVSKSNSQERRPYVCAFDIEAKPPWAISRLAFNIAELVMQA